MRYLYYYSSHRKQNAQQIPKGKINNYINSGHLHTILLITLGHYYYGFHIIVIISLQRMKTARRLTRHTWL